MVIIVFSYILIAAAILGYLRQLNEDFYYQEKKRNLPENFWFAMIPACIFWPFSIFYLVGKSFQAFTVGKQEKKSYRMKIEAENAALKKIVEELGAQSIDPERIWQQEQRIAAQKI